LFEFFKSSAWSLNALIPPWDSNVSIYIYIRDNPKATELPDAPQPRKPNELTWSSGALDGVFGHHMASTKPEEISRRVQKLLTALTRLLREAADKNLKWLCDAVLGESILPIADAFQSELSKIVTSHKAKVAKIGRYFAPMQTAKRQPSLESCCWKSLETELTHLCWKRWHSTTNSPCSQHSRWPMSPMILRKHCETGSRLGSHTSRRAAEWNAQFGNSGVDATRRLSE
jgi:hypothetical protein